MCNSSRSSTCHAMPSHGGMKMTQATRAPFQPAVAAWPRANGPQLQCGIHHGHGKSPSNCHLNRFKSATNVDFPVSVSHV